MRRLAIALLGVVAILIIVRGPVPPLPDRVLGVWYANNPMYAGRQLQLSEHSVLFRIDTALDTSSVHKIVRVRQSAVPEGTLFEVEYVLDEQSGDRSSFDFILCPDAPPRLLLAHRKDIAWTRVPPGRHTANALR